MHHMRKLLIAMLAVCFTQTAGSAAPSNFLAKPSILQSNPLIDFAAQRGTSGRGLSFSCEGLQCTCKGVEDCNDMFGSGKCGDIATCNDDDDTCKCLMFKKAPIKKKMIDKAPIQKVK